MGQARGADLSKFECPNDNLPNPGILVARSMTRRSDLMLSLEKCAVIDRAYKDMSNCCFVGLTFESLF
jgi:hypothetical protein